MKRLTCAKCGSVDFLKKGDTFVCRTCGRKYSASKVTKMISREKPAGKVKSSDISQAENNFRMVKKAFAVGNYKEADYICNKAIKMDKTDWKTWFTKGRAVGRRSTFDRSRIPEAIHAFSKALQYCPEEEREPLKTACKEELKVMQSVLLSKRIQYFKRRPDEENISGLRSDVNLILTTMAKFFPIPESQLMRAKMQRTPGSSTTKLWMPGSPSIKITSAIGGVRQMRTWRAFSAGGSICWRHCRWRCFFAEKQMRTRASMH